LKFVNIDAKLVTGMTANNYIKKRKEIKK